MLSSVSHVLKDACLVGILADALLPGKDKPLWPINWGQLAPLENMQLSNDPNACYQDERIFLLLSLLVTASNYDASSFNPPSWLTVHPLTYNYCPALLLDKDKNGNKDTGPGTLGYIFYHAELCRAMVVFSGTANGCMSMIDLDYLQVPYSDLANYQEHVMGHRGFYQAYMSIRSTILDVLQSYQKAGTLKELVICGHSLGGGMSNIAAYDLAGLFPIHYSFASPRVFNISGSIHFNKLLGKRSIRVCNCCDIVVTMPLAVMPNGNSFNHVGKCSEFQNNMANYSDNHSLAYLLYYQLVAVME